jgi:hypothetical protein
MTAMKLSASRISMLAAVALAASGCSVEPWVKPYELDHLADSIRSFYRDPVPTSNTGLVYEARDGARGATGGAGGGCGCN